MMQTKAASSVQSISPVANGGVGAGSIMNTAIVMLTSVILLHVAIQDGSQRPWVEWADLVVTTLLAVVAYFLIRKFRGGQATSVADAQSIPRGTKTSTLVATSPRLGQLTTESLPSKFEFGFLLLFGSLPFITDLILRQFASHGNPLEIQLTLAMRNLMFGLIILPRYRDGRLAIFTSLFIAIYGALVSTTATANVLLAVYALLGLWWLMGDYWQRISAHFPDESTTEIPYFARVGAIGLVLFCLAGGAIAFQSDALTTALSGFMPSSGGTGGKDQFARGGVGDGDEMVGATEDANSFGPIESQLFLESQQPTLYDMFIETYDEPVIKKRKGRSRAIPLYGDEQKKQNHKKFAQNKKASREFSAIRRESKDRKRQERLKGTDSKALFYVAGRTPLHLGLTVYDHWDGRNLSLRNELAEPHLLLEKDTADRNWATWKLGSYGDCFAEPERHLLKIINLNSSTIPAPPNLVATHIDKVHDPNFFEWENGMLGLSGQRIPELTVMHVKSRRLRREHMNELVLRKNTSLSLARNSFLPESRALRPVTSLSRRESRALRPGEGEAESDSTSPVDSNAATASPSPLDNSRPSRAEGEGTSLSSEELQPSNAILQLATKWTAGAQTDWHRVEKICQRLREFKHDPDIFVPEETDDAVEYFLFESRQGPDFLFATSAAVLLRSLGFQTRVISGLYADPSNYDRMAKSTGVFDNNVHFWAEVQSENGHWIAMEPTPGFKMLYAKQTFFQAATFALAGFVREIAARPVTCSLVLFTVLGGLIFRRPIYAAAATSWWRLRLNASPREQVLGSVMLLQRLTERKKSGRRTGQTLDQWLASLGESVVGESVMAEPSGASTAINEFRALVSWACYASSDRPSFATAPVRQICVDSVKLLKERV